MEMESKNEQLVINIMEKKDDIEHTSGDTVNVIEKFQDYWKGEEVELSQIISKVEDWLEKQP